MLILALTACFPNHAVYSAAVLCPVMFAVGWLSADINIRVKTTIQLSACPGCLGKVLGISTFISYILIPLSLVIAGVMSEVLPAFVLPMLSGSLLITVLTFLRLWEQPSRKQ